MALKGYETPCATCGAGIDRRPGRGCYGWHPDTGYNCVPCWEGGERDRPVNPKPEPPALTNEQRAEIGRKEVKEEVRV